MFAVGRVKDARQTSVTARAINAAAVTRRYLLLFAVHHIRRTANALAVRAIENARQTSDVCRAFYRRATFAMRLGKKRTAKSLPCVFQPLPCA